MKQKTEIKINRKNPCKERKKFYDNQCVLFVFMLFSHLSAGKWLFGRILKYGPMNEGE